MELMKSFYLSLRDVILQYLLETQSWQKDINSIIEKIPEGDKPRGSDNYVLREGVGLSPWSFMKIFPHNNQA